MKRLYALSLALLFLTVSCHAALGAPAANATKKQSVPTNIVADSVEYNANTQTVVFTGNVHVKRPDFEMWSLKMTVYLDKSTKKEKEGDTGGTMSGMQAGDIDRIVAEGKVRLKSEEKNGTSRKATYYVRSDKFVMEGDPVLTDKDTVIKGDTIVHFLEANKSDVNRADFTFLAPDKTGPGGKSKPSQNATKTTQQSQQ